MILRYVDVQNLFLTEVLIVAAVIESRNKNDVRILWRGDWKERENARLCDKNDKLLATRNNDINRYFARTLLCELYGKNLQISRFRENI